MIFGRERERMQEEITKPEVAIAICKCSSNRELYGIRLEKRRNNWEYTWTFPISERAAKSEGFDSTMISGPFAQGEEYPGCPYCKTINFFCCGTCGKLNCWDGFSNCVTCRWCNTSSSISGTIQELDTSNNM